jgi:hypothetical protein
MKEAKEKVKQLEGGSCAIKAVTNPSRRRKTL